MYSFIFVHAVEWHIHRLLRSYILCLPLDKITRKNMKKRKKKEKKKEKKAAQKWRGNRERKLCVRFSHSLAQ